MLYPSADYVNAGIMLTISAISVVFYCLSTVSNGILQGVNKMTTPVKHAAISLVIHLISVVFMLSVLKLGIYALVIGNEGEGVSRLVREKCDFIASIPMKGDIDSLNASVAAGVLAYEIVRQRLS